VHVGRGCIFFIITLSTTRKRGGPQSQGTPPCLRFSLMHTVTLDSPPRSLPASLSVSLSLSACLRLLSFRLQVRKRTALHRSTTREARLRVPFFRSSTSHSLHWAESQDKQAREARFRSRKSFVKTSIARQALISCVPTPPIPAPPALPFPHFLTAFTALLLCGQRSQPQATP